METAAAAMLEAGVGRFSRAPALATALLAEMWAPLAVALAALATLPSLLRRLQVIVLRLRSRGKEVIQSHIGTYYSSCDEDGSDDEEDESSDEEEDASSSGDDEREEDLKRIGFYDGAADGVFPWGGAVVRTWQGRFSGCASGLGGGVGGATSTASATGGAFPAAVRLWGASTASGEPSWWASCSADEGGCRDGAAAEAEAEAEQVVVGWRREHASQQQRRRHRRRAVPLVHTGK